LAMWARHEREQAVGTLTRALTLAEPEGYVRTFVDEGPAMGDLLSATLKARQSGRLDTANRVPARYLAKLLAAIARETAEPTADERLAEPPSERELEVLALIAAGESNPEIARALPLDEHRQDPHQPPLPQAGGSQPHSGSGPCQGDEPPLVGPRRLEHAEPSGRTISTPRSTLWGIPHRPTSRYNDCGLREPLGSNHSDRSVGILQAGGRGATTRLPRRRQDG
jgi:hypothetical protein